MNEDHTVLLVCGGLFLLFTLWKARRWKHAQRSIWAAWLLVTLLPPSSLLLAALSHYYYVIIYGPNLWAFLAILTVLPGIVWWVALRWLRSCPRQRRGQNKGNDILIFPGPGSRRPRRSAPPNPG